MAGLGDLQLARGDVPTVEVVDYTADWSAVADILELAPAVLVLWTEGTDYRDAVIYAAGRAQGVAYGTLGEPLSFEIVERLALDRQVPGPGDRVDLTTYPTANELPETRSAR